jgi:hypothetical protein
VSVGDKCTLVVEGWGSVTFKIWLSNGFQTIVLDGTPHVLRLATNLVSLGALKQEGSSFCSCEDGLVITQEGDKLFRATLNNCLYYINCTSDGINEMALTVLSVSLWLWHQHMGHLHLEATHKMAQKNMVNGLTISSLKEYDYVCKGCAWQVTPPAIPKGQLYQLHSNGAGSMDLTGPMSIETWSGMSYTFIAVEMNSWMSFGELLAFKDEVAETLKSIIVKLECQSSITTK